MRHTERLHLGSHLCRCYDEAVDQLTDVQSFSIYLAEYLSNNHFPGATPLDFGFVGGFNFAFAMLAAPFTTFLSGKIGEHAVILSGGVLQSIGYISASFSSQVWHLYLSQGALVGCGIGFIIVPSMPIISQWFTSKRSIANGISSAGSGLGGILFTWGTASLLQQVGLRWSLRCTGLVTIVAVAVATVLLRDRNRDIRPSQLAFDIRLLRRLDVILLLAWAFVSMFGYITLLFSLSDFSTSIGLSTQQSVDVVGLLNLGTAVGRPVIGVISDKTSRPMVAGLLTLLTGLLCFILWLPSTSFALTCVFSIISGATLGVFWMVSLVLDV